jgi:hypothetical protein
MASFRSHLCVFVSVRLSHSSHRDLFYHIIATIEITIMPSDVVDGKSKVGVMRANRSLRTFTRLMAANGEFCSWNSGSEDAKE